MTKLAELKQRSQENSEVRGEYIQADAELSLIEAMILVRQDMKLTQAEVTK